MNENIDFECICPNCGRDDTDDRISDKEGYWTKIYDYIVFCKYCHVIYGIYYEGFGEEIIKEVLDADKFPW